MSTRTRLSRRDFLIQGSAAAGLLASAPVIPALAAPAEGRKVMHIIGHSHIDAAWLWPWRDGADTALNTFRSALNRMGENPGFCYTHSSSMHYRWVERADPAMFAEIQKRIREGRWEVVGAWPVEPDCNIPATESFVRHALYGKAYCRRTLGVDVKIGFNPDSFGHAAGLPTILKSCGYDAYVFMRPRDTEANLPLLFWWEGPDGSRILTLRIWDNYDPKASVIPEAAGRVFAPNINHGAFFLGVGDHGGAVTAEQVREVTRMQADSSLPELRWSTLQSFFTAAATSPGFATLPVVRGELQHHSRGCYSAYGEGKFLNRRSERWMVETETISLVANLAANHAYPAQEFADSWWKLLFCQFHDLLAGTALYSDYQDLRDSLGYACEVAQTKKIEALETLAKRVDLSGVKEGAVFLFNPLPWRRKALVEFHTEKDPDGHGLITSLQAKDGTRLPIQFRPPDSMTDWNARASAPGSTFPPADTRSSSSDTSPHPPPPSPSRNCVTVSETGFGISSLKAEDGTELLAGPIRLIALSDTSDTWAHDVREFRQEMGRPMLVSASVVEDGPVTRVTRHRATWLSSEIILDIAQFAGIDAVELRFVIDWREHQQMLKLEVPTALAQPRLFARVPGEILERTTNGEEEPYQDWAAVQGKIGKDGKDTYTLGILNNSTYSYDCLDGLFRTVLIRSAPFARHQPSPVTYFDTNAWQDQGRQERRFWLVAGKGTHETLSLDRRSEELQTPAEYVVDSAHGGEEPWERSFLEVLPSTVWVLAVKRAEDPAAGTVIRIQERSGRAVTANLKSSLLALDHPVALAPWQIKTLLVQPGSKQRAELKEVSALEV